MKKKLEIVCPFCLKDTGRWQLVYAIKRPNTRGKWEWQEVDEVAAKKFEQKSLQNHLDKGECVNYVLSPSLLEMYNLIQPKDL